MPGKVLTNPNGSPRPFEEPASAHPVDRVVVQGIAWTAGGKWLTQVASWAATIMVARLLAPADYGLVGMATLYLGLIGMVSEFGIGAAVVALREVTQEQIEQLNTFSVFVGLCISLVSCALAYPISLFFRTPALVPVIMVLSTNFLVIAFRSVPNAVLQRELQFRDLALIDGARGLIVAVTAVVLAFEGFRYWTLVASEVTGTMLVTLMTIIRRPQRFTWPHVPTIRSAITVGWHVLIGRLSWYIYSNADFLVAGRVLGQAALGSYELAWTITNIPVEKVTSLLAGVTPAVFSAVQDNAQALKRYVLSLTETISVIAFPVACGIALIAGDLVPLVLGPKWLGAIAPLQLLAIYTGLRSVMPLIPNVLTVKGKTRFLMYHGIVSAIIFPMAFYAGSHYGTKGIAGAWVILYPLSIIPLLYVTFKVVLSGREYARALWPATASTLVMAGAVVLTSLSLPTTLSMVTRIVARVAIGMAVYSATLLLAFPDRIRLFREVLRTARSSE